MKLITAPDDLTLATRCASGDRAAQRRLFDEQKARVHGILYRILGSNKEVEDLAQEAFLEIFRSLGNFRGEAKLATWIDRVTTRVAYNYFSRKRPAPVSLEAVAEMPSQDASAERRVFVREAARRLYATLNKIDPNFRIAFTLHAIDGRPLREVAEITESSLVATKSRVWRARKEINKRAQKDPVLAVFLAGSQIDGGTGGES